MMNSFEAGGAELHVLRLAQHAIKSGHAVKVVVMNNLTIGGGKNIKDDFEATGAEISVMSKGRSLISVVMTWFRLFQVVKTWLPDIVHSHLPRSDLASSFLKSFRSKVIWTCTLHDAYNKEVYSGYWIFKIFGWRWRLADHVICVSEHAKKWAITTLSLKKDRVRVIHHGLPYRSSGEEHVKQVGSNVISCLARYENRKGIATLIRAMVPVVVKYPGARLIVCGGDPFDYRQEMGALAKKLGVDSCVELRGFCEDPFTFMRQSDVFAFASESEGFGLAVLEAMSLGLPTVVSDIHPLNYIVIDGDTGLVAELANPNSFAERIITLLADNELRLSLGARGRQRVLQNFSEEPMYEKTYETYYKSFRKKSNKIRILHVITSLNQGGAEGVLERLTNGLKSNFDHIIISLIGKNSYLENEISKNGGAVFNLNVNGFFSAVTAILSIIKIARNYRADIIQTWLYHADFLGTLARLLSGKRLLVWSVRCSSLDRPDAPWTTHILIRILSIFSFIPDGILFNSFSGRAAHKALGYRSEMTVIPNGFDLQKFQFNPDSREKFRSEIGVTNHMFVVGFIARFHRIKDHRCFLSAAKYIHSTNPHVRFVLVGLGMDSKNLELVGDIEKVGLRNFVTLLGSRSDIPCVMSGLDCLTLTSKSEGFSNVLGEAMALGLPCVSTDVGDARLILDDIGKVVPVGDAQAVANAIQTIINLGSARRLSLSRRNRKKIQDEYDLNDTVKRYTSFYKDIYEQRKIRTKI